LLYGLLKLIRGIPHVVAPWTVNFYNLGLDRGQNHEARRADDAVIRSHETSLARLAGERAL
jgi:hypothetical protein